MATIPLQVASRTLDTPPTVQYPQGSPIGEALSSAGNELQQVAVRMQARQEQADRFKKIQFDNQFDADLDNQAAELARGWAPDGAGLHDSIVGKVNDHGQVVAPGLFDNLAKQYRQQIPASQRAEWDASLQAKRLQMSGRAAQAQFGMEQDYAKVETGKIQDGLLNSILQMDPHDRATFDQFKAKGRQAIEASALGPLPKKIALDNWDGQSAETLFQSLITKDPQAAANAATLLGMAPQGGPVSAVVNRIIGAESGGNRYAKNPASSALGPGQFISGTWLRTVRAHRPDLANMSDSEVLKLRTDPALAREMTTRLTEDSAKALQAAGQPVTAGNLYLAHFAGQQGALQVLRSDDNAAVEDVLGPGVVNSNGFLRGKTVGWLKDWAAKKMGGAAGASGAPDPAFASIPPDRRQALLKQAEVQSNRNVADYESSMEDYLSFLRAGNTRDPGREGQVADILPPDRASHMQEQIDAAASYGADRNALAFASPGEVQEIMTRRTDMATASPEGFRQHVQDVSGLQTILTARNEAIKADPAGYVAQQPTIRAAYQAAQNGDPRASQAYANATLAEQARLGVPEAMQRILPASTAAHYVGQFNDQKAGPQNAATTMVALEQQYGKYWPQVFGELAATKQLSGTALVVGAMNRPDQAKAREQLAEAAKIGTTDLEKLVTPENKKTLADEVDSKIAPFAATLANNGASGTQTLLAFREAAYQLALQYSRSEDPSRAADRAYTDVIGRAYTVEDTYRVPIEQDAGKVSGGAEQIISKFDAAGVVLPASPYSEDTTRAAYARQVQARGFWVTSGDESGLTLYDETGAAVRRVDGTPVSYTWEQLKAQPAAKAAPGVLTAPTGEAVPQPFARSTTSPVSGLTPPGLDAVGNAPADDQWGNFFRIPSRDEVKRAMRLEVGK